MESSENTEKRAAETPDTETVTGEETGKSSTSGQKCGVKATTKIGPKDMYRFQLYHTYVGVTGLLLGFFLFWPWRILSETLHR